ncbi:MAG: SUMF1/EgtB/PvdO family nonheme iron enzyme, partial [Anaerolineae bacterium]|nr:SUMF1/EgtB/PvdO family nonheme iron enzyme [Anaerolineae bacterium]
AGTLPYMSPEQTDGVRDDPRLDLYALGAVLYRMLTGRTYLEFDQQETPRAQAENVGRIYNQQVQPPSVYNSQVPGWLDAMVLKTLAKRPEQRYQSAGALKQALQQTGRQAAPAPSISKREPIQSRPAAPLTPQIQSKPMPSPTSSHQTPPPATRAHLPRWFWPTVVGVAILVVALIVAIMALVNGGDETTTAGLAVVPTEVNVEATRTLAPTQMPTNTDTPTSEPTETNTPTAAPSYTAPPTSTPTETSAPTATLVPTLTLIPTDAATNTPAPTRATTLKAGDTRVRQTDSMTMGYVPAGEFMMGGDGGDDDEKPAHTVYLDAFWIDRTEVTNAQFQQCVAAGACKVGKMFNYNPEKDADISIDEITWAQANAYCSWVGARLPTEAEWEKAARGTDGRKYPWGNGEPNCDKACYEECECRRAAADQRTAGASPYGALDMAGNLWEWASDWYDNTYYTRSPARNPQGPDSGSQRVLRGGAYWFARWDLRTANRWDMTPGDHRNDIGFRCVVDSP